MKNLLIFTAAFLFNPHLRAEEDFLSALDMSDSSEEYSFLNSSSNDSMANRLLSSDPDLLIHDFYKRRIPANEVKVPNPTNGELVMWKPGNVMRDLKIPAGEYSVIRVEDKSRGYHIRFLGRVRSDGMHATVTEAINEILPGDLIVKESYSALSIPPLTGDGGAVAKQQESLGEVFALIEPEQDEKTFFSGTRQLIGAKFSKYTGGNSVAIGSTFEIRRKGEAVAKAIVIDADLDLATLYIFESQREVMADDEIFPI